MKKVAVMIYPYFSMQEISCLTDALAIYFNQKIEVFASKKEVIMTEDCFQVLPHKTFDEFVVDDYSCLILPGIANPLPALFDNKNIEFLETLKGKDILIASISSSPMLLAKAGLLENKHFISGMWDEVAQNLEFIPYENIVYKPIVKDGNLITAIGFAFREFAEEVIKELGIDDCEKGLFKGIMKSYDEDDLKYSMGKENYHLFEKEYHEMFLKSQEL